MHKDQHMLKAFLLKFFRGFLLVCVLLTYGGGSALVQGVAWITMMPMQMIESGSFEDGIKNTFDGDHACSLCALASELRSSEEEVPPSNKQDTVKKVDSKEKTAFALLKFKNVVPCNSFVLVAQERACLVQRLQLDVEVPPPDCIS